MVNLIRSEWIKFRSVRSTLVTLILAGGLVVLIGVISATQPNDDFPPIRFDTIRPTFTAMPRRWRVLVAKLVVVTSACAAISILMVGFCWLIGSVMVDGFEVDGFDRRTALGIVLFSIGWSALGMGVGAIVRQPIAGILILLAEAFVVENIVAGLVPSLAKWMPFINGFQMTFRVGNSGSDFQSVLGGGIYFFAVATAVWLIGAGLATRRDA